MKSPRIRVAVLLLATILPCHGEAPAGGGGKAPKLTVEPLSMTISKFDRDTFGHGRNPFDQFSRNAITGTNLLVKVTPPPSLEAKLVASKHTLHSFCDDRGNDLLSLPKNQRGNMFMRDSKNMRVLQTRRGDFFGIQLSAPNAPAASATRIIVKGSLFFAPEDGVAEVGHQELELKADTTVKVGLLQLKFSRPRMQQGAQEGLWQVQIVGDRNVSNPTLQLFGADPDVPIRDTENSAGGGTYTVNGTVFHRFSCPDGKISRIKVRYTPVDKLFEIPFQCETGLGDFAGGGRIEDPLERMRPHLKPGSKPGQGKDAVPETVRRAANEGRLDCSDGL